MLRPVGLGGLEEALRKVLAPLARAGSREDRLPPGGGRAVARGPGGSLLQEIEGVEPSAVPGLSLDLALLHGMGAEVQRQDVDRRRRFLHPPPQGRSLHRRIASPPDPGPEPDLAERQPRHVGVAELIPPLEEGAIRVRQRSGLGVVPGLVPPEGSAGEGADPEKRDGQDPRAPHLPSNAPPRSGFKSLRLTPS